MSDTRKNSTVRPESPLEELPMMLKVTEVASYLRVTRQMLYQVIREGGIKSVRVGKAMRISRDTLRDFIAGEKKEAGK